MNPINRVTELKIRKTKLATILTAISEDLSIPVEFQLMAVNEWDTSSGRVIVHSAYKMPVKPNNGIRIAPTKATKPSVADVLRAYVVQIPGDEIFAIAAPSVQFSPNQIDLFKHVEYEKMERAWACSLSVPGSNVPAAYIMSAPVLPHILRDIPNTLTFGHQSWSVWFNDWLGRFMLKHRYFDATRFNIVTPLSGAVDQSSNIADNYKIEPNSVPSVPEQEIIIVKLAKGKPGRKPKSKALAIDTTVEF